MFYCFIVLYILYILWSCFIVLLFHCFVYFIYFITITIRSGWLEVNTLREFGLQTICHRCPSAWGFPGHEARNCSQPSAPGLWRLRAEAPALIIGVLRTGFQRRSNAKALFSKGEKDETFTNCGFGSNKKQGEKLNQNLFKIIQNLDLLKIPPALWAEVV